MSSEAQIEVEVRLLPPLSNTAGRDRVKIKLERNANMQAVIDALLERFNDPAFRLHLYDTEGRLIPAWRVFINDRPALRLASPADLKAPVSDRDEITFLLGLGGG